MITSRIKKIDSTSIELKAKYRPKYNKRVKFQKYSVETYMFIPIELGINKRNFTKIDFYREYKNFLKIDTPKILLSEIANKKTPFIQTYARLFNELDIENADSIEKLDDNTKILLNIFKKAIKREAQKVKQYSDPKEKIRVSLRLINDLDKSIERYRNRHDSIVSRTNKDYSIYTTIKIGDEYISNLKYRFLHEILLHLMDNDDVIYYDTIGIINKSLDKEIEYRRVKKYPLSSIQKRENEKLIARWEIIKYFITNKLIIRTKIENESKYLEEILYSFAAGIAMVFATGIAFYYNQKFGNFTASFFVVLVLSYMFKDRIKEWARSFFNSILHKQLLDHHFSLYDDNSKKIGISKDGFEFIPLTSISSKINSLRYSEEMLGAELINHDEKVMKFTRKISLNMQRFIKTFEDTNIRGINDIINFNFAPIIMRMQETKFPIYASTSKGKIKVIKAEKTFAINLIQAVSINKETHYQHYTVYIAKSGIKKLVIRKN